MPTPEEVKKMALRYALEKSEGEAYDPFEEEYAAEVLQWLSKDFCIVPKSKVKELHTRNAKIITQSDDRVLNAYSEGVMTAIERLFGKSLFEEEK